MIGVSKLAKSFGARTLFEGATFQLNAGSRYGLVGANGSGKSTFMKVLAGDEPATDGLVTFPPNARVGVLRQDHFLSDAEQILALAMRGDARTYALLEERSAIVDRGEGDPHRLADIEHELSTLGGTTLEARATAVLVGLGIPAAQHRQPLSTLSGGFKLRVLLAQVLVGGPDALLLDEPTNHLDAESVAWLERFLKEYKGTVVAVTHDRYFLDDVAQWILELDRGKGYPFEGNYSGWLEQKSARLLQEEKQESARQRKLKQELEWVRSSPRARQAKSKARLAAYEDLVNKANKGTSDGADISIPPGPRLGDVVVEAEGLGKGFGDRLLIDDLSFRLPRSGIVGVIGPNGAGKTTLFRMLVGEEKPDKGTLRVGETVKIAYVDQSREALKGDKSVWEEISNGDEKLSLGKREVSSRAYCNWFGFKGADQQKKVGTLSGGERNRVHLAKLLKTGGNFLLLDEPTNDLDVDTLRSLEDALTDFPGCAVIISHDRWFLDRIATHILAFEGDSHVEWFEGNYQAYEADKKKRLGVDADQPHRIKYKKLKL